MFSIYRIPYFVSSTAGHLEMRVLHYIKAAHLNITCFFQIWSNALIKRGSLKMQNGDQSAALEDFATAVQEDAENSDIYHHRGQVGSASFISPTPVKM